MTGEEVTRLAVLETQVDILRTDVTEIKGDVKSLVQTQQQLALALAVKETRDRRTEEAGSSIGVWVRFALPWIISLITAIIVVTHFVLEVTSGS